MNLVLQGLHTNRAAVEAIIQMMQPQRVTDIDAHAWRCEGVAYSDALKAQLDAVCLAQQIDYAFVETGCRLKDFRLVAMDMDSTLITIECIDEIADMAGIKPQVAAITELAMRGDIDFRTSLERRVALLAGLPEAALQRVYDERLRLSPGAERMIEGFKAVGATIVLLSGGFTFFTDRL